MEVHQIEDRRTNASVSCNAFTNDFYKVFSSNTDGNTIISPISIHLLLSLLAHGSHGETLNDLETKLYLSGLVSSHIGFSSLISTLNDIKGIELKIANTIYVEENLKLIEAFLAISKDVFHCTVSTTNFKNNIHAAQQINNWIATATNNKISNVVSADDFEEDTKLVLINTLYFKGQWLNYFDPKFTENKAFHISKTDTRFVPMMFKKSRFGYGQIPSLNATFLEIPYANNETVMVIILPNDIEGLNKLEDNFALDAVLTEPTVMKEFELYLPKFKFDVTINLEDTLRKMGLHSIFEDSADFSGVSDTPLKVSSVLQKVYIDVNEEGSEAACATVVQMRLKRSAHMTEQYLVNRPFMFLIWHKPTNIPLFVGSIREIGTSEIKDEL